jgi:hypothetical protein
VLLYASTWFKRLRDCVTLLLHDVLATCERLQTSKLLRFAYACCSRYCKRRSCCDLRITLKFALPVCHKLVAVYSGRQSDKCMTTGAVKDTLRTRVDHTRDYVLAFKVYTVFSCILIADHYVAHLSTLASYANCNDSAAASPATAADQCILHTTVDSCCILYRCCCHALCR